MGTTLRGRCGTYSARLAPVARWGPVWRRGCFCGRRGIKLHFAWQAWRYRPPLCVFVWRITLGGGVALRDIDLLCVAGVALGDIHLHFAWQAWRHRPPHFAWTPAKRFARVMEQTPEDTELLKMPSEYGRFLCVSMRLMRGAKISQISRRLAPRKVEVDVAKCHACLCGQVVCE